MIIIRIIRVAIIMIRPRVAVRVGESESLPGRLMCQREVILSQSASEAPPPAGPGPGRGR